VRLLVLTDVDEVRMKHKLSVVLLVLVVILAGCGGQGVEPPTGPTTPGGELFQIALPRLVVDVDAEGNPSILGISPALLASFGVDVSGFQLPAELVQQFTAAGVQHLEVASVGDRIMLFENGKPLPHLGWTQDSLNRMLNLLDTLKVENSATIRRILPIITRLGLDVVIRFPRDPGVAEIPFIDTSTVRSFQPTVTTEPPSAVIKFEVRFNEEGQAGMMGLTADDLAALGMGSMLRLAPETLANFQAGNIQHMEIRTKPDGGYIYVNNEPLPRLIWDTQLLANAVDLYARLSPEADLLPLVQQIAPYLDRADLGILLRFPVAAGQAEIPAELH
jgi:hypothetical protein